MNIFKKIKNQKDLIVPELYQWAETFNPENIMYNKNYIDEKDEAEMFQSYNNVKKIAERLENNECKKKDYENIFFHINQINYNEKITKL